MILMKLYSSETSVNEMDGALTSVTVIPTKKIQLPNEQLDNRACNAFTELTHFFKATILNSSDKLLSRDYFLAWQRAY